MAKKRIPLHPLLTNKVNKRPIKKNSIYFVLLNLLLEYPRSIGSKNRGFGQASQIKQ
jgi:hypothetical protein